MPNIDIVKKLLQDMVVPELKEISSELREFRAETRVEIKRLDEKIDSMDKRLNEKIDSLDDQLNEKIDSLDERLNEKIDSLRSETSTKFDAIGERIDSLEDKFDTNTEFRERFAALEARVAAFAHN